MQRVSKWLALGDSITWGYPVGPSVSWTSPVSEALGMPVDNHGVNGDTLDGMAERLSFQLQCASYAFAVWMGGSNDVACGFRLDAMQRHALRIAESLSQSSVPFVVGLPIPLHVEGLEERLVPFRQWLRDSFPHVIDFSAAFPPARRDLLPDGVHPSEAGYAAMGALAIPIIKTAVFPVAGSADLR